MENLLHFLFNFGYVLIFSILALGVAFINMPAKERGIESYRKSRMTLATALGVMAIYCIIRIIIPEMYHTYVDLWLLMTFTLIFSWLSYSSFLFLIETPRFLRRHFLADGIIPSAGLLVFGFIGVFFPSTRIWIEVIFGIIYALKCSWMFYTCLKEYRKCQKELDNYYDQGPDIKWMRTLLILSFILSVGAILTFYIREIGFIYYIALPVIYSYMSFKVINFAPKKIDSIRRRNMTLDQEEKEEEKKTKSKDLAEKLSPIVEKWVNEKKFCKEGLTIKDVALEMGTNHNYLSQYINNNLNMTFQIWLNTLRIEESKILLTSKERLSIEEVGVRVGIPQNYNFSRWFKVVTDMTPFQYKRTHLKG